MMKEMVLVTKVLGLNEGGINNAAAGGETGECEALQCVNFIPNSGGFLTLAPAREFLVQAPGAIVALFYGCEKVFVQCGATLYRLDVDVFTPITGAAITGTVKGVVTEIDARFTNGTTVWKVAHGSNVAAVCAVGVHANPTTSMAYSAMPVFNKAFTHGGALFVVNGAFLQSSEINYYDCWNFADTYIWVGEPIVDAGSVPGCIVVLTGRKVVVITGYNKKDFKYTEYPVKAKGGTLWSGFSDDVNYVHMFIAEDGIYVVTPDGKLANTSKHKCNAGTFSGIYNGAALIPEGYFAYSDIGCVHQSLVSAGYFKGECDGILYGNGMVVLDDAIYTLTNTVDTGMLRLPPMSFGTAHKKRVRAMYITGVIVGTVCIEVLADDGTAVVVEEAFTGLVKSHRLQGFSMVLSNNVKITLTFEGEYFDLFELSAHVTTSPRY